MDERKKPLRLSFEVPGAADIDISISASAGATIRFPSPASASEINIREIQRLRDALKDIAGVLGTGACGLCCQGCMEEFNEAVRIAREALGDGKSQNSEAGQ